MKAKVKLTGEIIEVERITSCSYGRTDGATLLYPKDALDLNPDPPQPEATISGWVARDQSNSFSKRGPLHVFHHKPSRDYFDDNDVICGFWDEDISPSLPLAENLFPSLAWQDEPIEVEITIKPKKR